MNSLVERLLITCMLLMRIPSFAIVCGTAAVFLLCASPAAASPIQKVTGIITEVGEGFVLVKPDDESPVRRFLLRWKARFEPPKLPLKGDRVLVFYKDKPEGAVIYGVQYLNKSPELPIPPH